MVALLTLVSALPALAQEAGKEPAYRAFPLIGSRLAVWAIAQLHLNFAAFILGVPIFAVIIEIMGWRTRDAQYDWLSHELVKLTFAAFSTTALLGALLLFLLIGYYPKFWTYMTSIFFPTYGIYAGLFFAETFTVYIWYYGWDWLSGPRKWIHVSLGVLSNVFVGNGAMGGAAVAYVGCDGCVTAHNTIVDPQVWVVRILQETTDARFVPSRNGLFVNNIIVLQTGDIRTTVNVGGGTAPDTFTFGNNVWWATDDPGWGVPSHGSGIPDETGSISADPGFADAAGGDYRIAAGSPAFMARM